VFCPPALLFGGGLFVTHNCTVLITYIALFNRLHNVEQRKAYKLNCTLLICRLTGIVQICLNSVPQSHHASVILAISLTV